jgi:hypothetical protein
MPLSRVSSSPLRVEYGRPWSVPKLYFVLVCHSQRLDIAKQLHARPYFGRLGAQFVEFNAVLQDADEGVRRDVLGEGKGIRIAQPAPRQLQRCIAEAGLLEVAPYCRTLAGRRRRRSRHNIWGRRA